MVDYSEAAESIWAYANGRWFHDGAAGVPYLRADIAERQIAELREVLSTGVCGCDGATSSGCHICEPETHEHPMVLAIRQIAELRAERDDLLVDFRRLNKRAEAAEAENARLRALPLKEEVERVLEQIADEYGITGTWDEKFKTAQLLAGTLLSRLRAGEQEGRDGLSEWTGWDKSRHPWGETKHKDAVLEALFRGPWSVEDAAALIGFIDRTWTRRSAAPSEQGGDRS